MTKPTHGAHSTRSRTASIVLSVVALVGAVVLIFLRPPAWNVGLLALSILIGVIALSLALTSRRDTSSAGSARGAIVLAVLAVVAPVIVLAVVTLPKLFPQSATYQITVESTGPIDVVINADAELTEEQWKGSKTITIDSSGGVVAIGAQAEENALVISCEIKRDGVVLDQQKRAGSVNCSYIRD